MIKLKKKFCSKFLSLSSQDPVMSRLFFLKIKESWQEIKLNSFQENDRNLDLNKKLN